MGKFIGGMGMAVIAVGFLIPPASAMTRQAPPMADGKAVNIADPDEAAERASDRFQGRGNHGRYRTFSDSSNEARDIVRSAVNGGNPTPYR